MNQTIYTPDLTGNRMLVERVFDAGIELVWQAWTDPELLTEWWAPKPYKAIIKHMDFREAGYCHYYMLGPDGSKFWCRFDYINIENQQRFTGQDYFCDEEGNNNPELTGMHWEVIFSATGTGTKVNVVITFASKEDMEKIISMGFKEGFSMAHNNLDELLKNKNK